MSGVFNSRRIIFHSFIMLWLRWIYTVYLISHKYDWHHFIDTVFQLYRIVGLGIKLKSMSVRSCRWTSHLRPRKPHCSKSASQKGKFELCFNVSHDRCICLPVSSAIFSASLLLILLHSDTIPPLVVKTRWLNGDMSMSITLWLYLSSSFSCCWYIW